MNHRLACLIGACVFASSLSQAQWTATGKGPFSYDDPANWKEGVINDQITNDPGDQQIIRVSEDRVLPGGLLIQQPTKEGKNFRLSFDGRWNERLAKTPRTWVMDAPLRSSALSGDFVVSSRNIDFDFRDNPAIFDVQGYFVIDGHIRSSQGLVKRGPGRLYVNESNKEPGSGISGPVFLERGMLVLDGFTRLSRVTSMTLAGDLSLSSGQGEQESLDRVPDTLPIDVRGNAGIWLSAGIHGTSQETLGVITIHGGSLLLVAQTRGREDGAAELTIAGLVRPNDGAILFLSHGPVSKERGPSGRILLLDDRSVLGALRGGGGAPGTDRISILPWARATPDFGGGLVTYRGNGGGFQVLNPATEYALDVNTADPKANVKLGTCVTLIQSRTVNSLYFPRAGGAGRPLLDLGGHVLTVTSGAIALESDAEIINGMLTTGSGTPFIIVGRLHMNANLTGSGGLIASSDVILRGGNNQLTGDYYVSRGTFSTEGDRQIPDTVTMRISEGGIFSVGGWENISGLAGNGVVELPDANVCILDIGQASGHANRVTMGIGGKLCPGDISSKPGIGTLRIWKQEKPGDPKDPKYKQQLEFAVKHGHGGPFLRPGGLYLNGGELCVDLAGTETHDRILLSGENKTVHVNGGILRVNLLEGYRPELGTKWTLLQGSLPADGNGFDKILDVTGKGYKYVARPVNNDWVLEVTAIP